MEDTLYVIKNLAVPVLVILGIIGFCLLPHLLDRYTKKGVKKGGKCGHCKGERIVKGTFLYLIPATFEHEHDQSAEYYVKNASPIENEEQIPTGRRACRMYLLQCQDCGNREVRVVDFLRVRDEEVIQTRQIYPYEKLQKLFY